MLILGPAATCDVCYERFGPDHRAPTSISCGHVFCSGCISQISRVCPMCRIPFDQRMCIKLHIDHNERCSAEDTERAQKLQKAITNIVDQGISEPDLRQLIQEAKSFLQSQPRDLHKDLRVLHRMVSYLCEVKATARSQKQKVEALNDQILQLNQEKTEFREQIAELDKLRKYERDTAMAVETSLRGHHSEAICAYNAAIEQCNELAKRNSELMLRVSTLTSVNHSEMHGTDGTVLTPSNVPSLLSPVPEQTPMSGFGFAIQDPDSSFLSPLPQFTSARLSIAASFAPLPDLAQDDEEDDDSTEDEEDGLSTPDSGQHQPRLRGSKDHPTASTLPVLRSEGKIRQEPSGLSRTAPYLEHRRPRSRSNPSQPTSRSRSRSRSPFDITTSSTPPRSPLQNNVPPTQPQTAYRASSRETHTSSSQPPFQPQEPHILISRLQDILRDSATSSSLPNMPSSHFPASITSRDTASTRDGSGSPPPPSRTGSSNSASKTTIPVQQQSPNNNVSHLLASSSQSYPNKPPPSISPNPLVGPRISTASAEAKKLEEERKRKQKEERNSQGQEYDRYPADADHDSRRPKGTSATVSSASQAARRDQQQPYATQLPSNASLTPSSSLRHGPSQTTAGTYVRSSGPGLAPLHEHGSAHQGRYPATKASSKHNAPVLLPNPALHT